MNHCRPTLAAVAAYTFFIAFFLTSLQAPSFAQNVSKMRDYLHLRDALEERKTRIQNELTRTPDVGPLDARLDIRRVQEELVRVEDWLNKLEEDSEGLTGYYRDRINRLITEIRYLLPALEKREASLTALHQGGSIIAVTPAPLPASATVLPAPGSSAAPAVATASIPEPTSDLAPAKAPPPPPQLTPAQVKKQRKAYFASMGVRLLRTPTLKKPSTTPIMAVTATATVPVAVTPVPASAAPALQVPTVPTPVTAAGTELTTVSAAAGDDPQTHQRKGMRPLAIMIENHNQARPQTALDEAEVVYEIPVEGGITRFMALFYHVAGIIGPIRSCRDYFVDRALEVNALYVHCGGSPQGYEYIQKVKALAIDEISSGDPFFRDKVRKAPHNLYARMQDIIDYVAKKFPMELPYQKMPFLYSEQPSAGSVPCRGISIKYHGNYTLVYKFNARHNRYDRYMNGIQHLDRITSKPVSPGTVIVQVAFMKTIDDKGRQDISFIGKGKAFILYGGVILPVTWEKTGPREFTRWLDAQGRPVRFDQKKPIWVQVVAPKTPLAFDPPLPADIAIIPPSPPNRPSRQAQPLSQPHQHPPQPRQPPRRPRPHHQLPTPVP